MLARLFDRIRPGVTPLMALLFLLLLVPCLGSQQDEPKQPFRNLREHLSDYQGPPGETRTLVDVEEVRIGYFGPSDPSHPEGGDLWVAANLALSEENRSGGYASLPFRFVTAWSENPWGTGVSQLVRMVYEEGVWAIIGSIDSSATHLAEQVVAKARVPLISPASTDKTANLANVPWLFSSLPGDHRQILPLVRELALHHRGGQLVFISATDHDSRVLAGELEKRLAEERMSPAYHFVFAPAISQPFDFLNRVVEAGPTAVVVMAPAAASATMVSRLRSSGLKAAIFGGPSMGRTEFLVRAGSAAEGVLFPWPAQPPREGAFAATFSRETGHTPDYAACQMYDSVRLLAAAIRSAGLNRAAIRETIRSLSPWNGLAGRICWDPLGQNERVVPLATIRQMHVVVLKGTGEEPPNKTGSLAPNSTQPTIASESP